MVLWFSGGILLLPVNSSLCGMVFCLQLNIGDKLWSSFRMQVFAFQIVFNFFFFLLLLFLGSFEKAEKGRISYDLKRAVLDSTGNPLPANEEQPWEFHFYHEKNGQYKEIPLGADDATPFQKAYIDSDFASGGLPSKGLIRCRFSDGSIAPSDDKDRIGKIVAFNNLSEEEARTYIDRCNTPEPPLNAFGEGVLACVIGSFFFTFFVTLCETFGIGLLFCPLWALAIAFGPILLGLLNTFGFFSAIGSAFAPRRS